MVPHKGLKLLQLPYLALLEIWKSLSYQEILFLSLCSTRTFNLMKLNKRNIDSIIYEDDVKELNVSIQTKDRLYQNFFAVKCVSRFEQGSKVMRLSVGGIDEECMWESYGIVIIDSSRNKIQLAADKHLNELFRTSEVDLKLSGDNVAQNMFPNVQNVTDLGVKLGKFWYSSDVGIDLLDPILERYPNRESLNIGSRYHGDIRPESKLFEIDNIHIDWSAHNSSILLDNFTGRCIHLGNTNLDDAAVIRFLDAWISEEKYQQLKSCYLHSYPELTNFDYQKVLNIYRERAKSWDRPTNNPLVSSRTRLFDTSTPEIMFFRDGSTLNIERDTDGKKATFTIFGNAFLFYVWD